MRPGEDAWGEDAWDVWICGELIPFTWIAGCEHQETEEGWQWCPGELEPDC